VGNNVGDLWNRLFEMSERIMDRDLTREALKDELAKMDGLYKASKSVIDLTNAVTRMRVTAKSEDIALPEMFTNMGFPSVDAPDRAPGAPAEVVQGKRPPLLPGKRAGA